MAFKYERETEQLMKNPAFSNAGHEMDCLKDSEALKMREIIEAQNAFFISSEVDPGIEAEDHEIISDAGNTIKARMYRKKGIGNKISACVIYAHGGGKVAGSIKAVEPIVTNYVLQSEVPFLSVEYGLAPENSGEKAARDIFDAVCWVKEHCSELEIDPDRIAVMGDSGGAGPAAGAAILARDAGVSLKKQLLIYPMLDDRNTEPDKYLEPMITWSYKSNRIGWQASLGEGHEQREISPIAVPARNTDWDGLAPAFIDVGELDIFRDESVAYAQNLWHHGINAELHVQGGCVHGFDNAPISIAGKAINRRIEVIKEL